MGSETQSQPKVDIPTQGGLRRLSCFVLQVVQLRVSYEEIKQAVAGPYAKQGHVARKRLEASATWLHKAQDI